MQTTCRSTTVTARKHQHQPAAADSQQNELTAQAGTDFEIYAIIINIATSITAGVDYRIADGFGRRNISMARFREVTDRNLEITGTPPRSG
jgi:hypothetical protein